MLPGPITGTLVSILLLTSVSSLADENLFSAVHNIGKLHLLVDCFEHVLVLSTSLYSFIRGSDGAEMAQVTPFRRTVASSPSSECASCQ